MQVSFTYYYYRQKNPKKQFHPVNSNYLVRLLNYNSMHGWNDPTSGFLKRRAKTFNITLAWNPLSQFCMESAKSVLF